MEPYYAKKEMYRNVHLFFVYYIALNFFNCAK